MSWAFRSIIRILIALGLLLAGAVVSAGGDQAGVEGRLVTGSEPVPRGQVSAYRSINLTGEPAGVSLPSGSDGRYNLDLAPGIYYLAASAGGMWTWCGQNPVSVAEGKKSWIGFALAPWSDPVVRSTGDDTMEGRVTGTVLRNGKPLADATVSLYFDETDGFRGMGFMRTSPTGSDGIFQMDMVPEGSYYLIARKRGSGLGVGPMVKGDLISYYRYNPVRIEDGKEIQVTLPMVVKRIDKDLQSAGLDGDRPGFEGVVTDSQGRPVPDVHVFAYSNPEMGHHKPAALSSLTDEHGKYRIYLPDGGKYYIGAREGYGDNPSPGEMFGHYEGTPDHSLVLKDGQYLERVDVVVKEVLAP